MGNIWCEELWILFKTKEAAVCFDSFCNKFADEIEGFKCEGIIETYSGFLKTASAEPLFQLFDAGWHLHRLMSGFYEHHPSIDFSGKILKLPTSKSGDAP